MCDQPKKVLFKQYLLLKHSDEANSAIFFKIRKSSKCSFQYEDANKLFNTHIQGLYCLDATVINVGKQYLTARDMANAFQTFYGEHVSNIGNSTEWRYM